MANLTTPNQANDSSDELQLFAFPQGKCNTMTIRCLLNPDINNGFHTFVQHFLQHLYQSTPLHMQNKTLTSDRQQEMLNNAVAEQWCYDEWLYSQQTSCSKSQYLASSNAGLSDTILLFSVPTVIHNRDPRCTCAALQEKSGKSLRAVNRFTQTPVIHGGKKTVSNQLDCLISVLTPTSIKII